MKKTTLLILTITCIHVLFQGCGKEVKCKDFSSDERAWVPFNDGEVFTYKNIAKDTTVTLKARKASSNQLKGNKYEGQHYCINEEHWWLENPDPIHGFDLSVSIRNGQTNKKNSYYFNFKAYDTQYALTDAVGKQINSINYNNVLTLATNETNVDSIYYGKGEGCIAFHEKHTNQWFYKQ